MISFLKKYCSGWWAPIGWSVFMGILLFMPGSLLPHENTFVIPQFDKVVHIVMFGGFVFLWSLWLSNREIPLKRRLALFFIIFLVGIGYGIGSEYIQKYFIPGRDYDNVDIIADMIGASLAYGICNIVLSTGYTKK